MDSRAAGDRPLTAVAPRRSRLRLEHLAWGVVIYCGVTGAISPRRTYDIWWHLATGKLIVEQHAIPDSDPFSWTREGTPWITHEWGWEIPMYLMYSRWGFAGLMALRVMVVGIASALLAWVCLARGATPLAVMAVGALAIFSGRPVFNDRPQVVTIPFFMAVLCLIEMSERGRERWLLLVPVLMVPWVNIHGGFIFGPALLGLYAVVCAVRWVAQHREGRPLRPVPAIVALALVLSLAATLVNPHGLAGAIYPSKYLFGEHAWHKDWISEYQSPDFNGEIFFFLGVLIVASTVVFAASGRRARLWDLAIVGVFLFTALKWQRNMGLYSMAIAPIFALHLSDLLRLAGIRSFEEMPEEREPGWLYAAILAVLVAIVACGAPNALRKTPGIFEQDYPIECVRYIEQTHLPGRMFNTYHWGGYLIWKLWPEQKVFVDGRADVMGRDLLMDWERAHRLNAGWQDVLEKYEIDWVLISSSSPLCRALAISPDWRPACEEPEAQLFVRVGTAADRAAVPVSHIGVGGLGDRGR